MQTKAKTLFASTLLSCLALAGMVQSAVAQQLLSTYRTINNPNPAVSDFFGNWVAPLGAERVLIGAPADDAGVMNAGVAYVYSLEGALLTTITNPTPDTNDSFGYPVVGVGSDRILIGANRDDTGAIDAGAAYLFTTNGLLLATLTNPVPTVSGYFGYAAAALGTDRVLISAYSANIGANGAGAAYLFGTNGARLTTFTNPNTSVSDNFGTSVATVGTDRVLIGAPGQSNGTNSSDGAAYLFNTNGLLLATITNPVPSFNARFGIAMEPVGTDKLLIGAHQHNNSTGHAFLVSTNGALLIHFTNPTPVTVEQFGVAVAAVGTNRLLIAAPRDSTGGSLSGSAYLYSTNGTLLATIPNPTPEANDGFGYSVAGMGSSRVLVGARTDNTGALATGSAYIIDVGFPTVSIGRESTKTVTISWSTSEPDLVLQQSDGIGNPTVWTDVTESPMVSGTTNTFNLTVPEAQSTRYYSLRRR